MAKLYKTYDDLLIFLQKEKNLIIHDQNAAKHILLKTGYFSLISGYKNNFKNPTTNKYIDGTTFEDFYDFFFDLEQILKKYIPTKNIFENMGFPANWETILPLKF